MSGIAGGVRGGRSDFELPDEIISVLPTDPFQQLDLAKKITSIAITSRVSYLETEVVELRQKLHEREIALHELEGKASRLERGFREADTRFKIVLDENMNLKKERDSLAATVKNLRCDMAKLERFKRQLIQSLSNENAHQTESVDIRTCDQSVPVSYPDNDQRTNLHTFHHSYSKSAEKAHPVDQASKYTRPTCTVTQYISPWITPTMTPKIISSQINSPRRTSGAMSPTNTHPEREKTNLLYPSSQQSSAANSPPRGLPLPARTPRIDGKEFFRQARSRLSYEQFRAFLANIKELNAQKQTRQETLRRADEILGTENKDLYLSFQGLINKNKS